jgi:hypothetical protein
MYVADISIYSDSGDVSTVYLFENIPTTESSTVFKLPAARRHDVPCVQHQQMLFFACQYATTQFGDIVAVDINNS